MDVSGVKVYLWRDVLGSVALSYSKNLTDRMKYDSKLLKWILSVRMFWYRAQTTYITFHKFYTTVTRENDFAFNQKISKSNFVKC